MLRRPLCVVLLAVAMTGAQIPSLVSATRLTADPLHAGDTIRFSFALRDSIGLLPGLRCDSVYYVDSLAPPPYSSAVRAPVVVLGDATQLAVGRTFEFAAGGRQCYRDGADTIGLVYTDLPSDPTVPHTLRARLRGVEFAWPPFLVYPGSANYVLLSVNGQVAVDTVRLTAPRDMLVVEARTYDEFGNARGAEPCSWSVTGTLTPTMGVDTALSRLFYETAQTTVGQQGWIIARYPTGTIADSVYVVVTVPPSTVASAKTLDADADGYLDGVRIGLSGVRACDFVSSLTPANVQSAFEVTLGQRSWVVDSAVCLASQDTAGNCFVLALTEDTAGGPIQTDWRPHLSVSGIAGLADVAALECADGAGPVVAGVTVFMLGCPGVRDTLFVTISGALSAQARSGIASQPAWQLFGMSICSSGVPLDDSVCQRLLDSTVSVRASVDTTVPNTCIWTLVQRQVGGLSCLSIRQSALDKFEDLSGNCALETNVPRAGGALLVMDRPCPQAYEEPSSSSDCGCGAGAEAAFLPPVVFSAGAWWRRRKARRR